MIEKSHKIAASVIVLLGAGVALTQNATRFGTTLSPEFTSVLNGNVVDPMRMP